MPQIKWTFALTSLILTTKCDGAPASDPAVDATVEGAPRCCQADWSDIFGKSHRRGKFKKSDIIIKFYGFVVVRVTDDPGNRPRDFVRVF